MTNVTDTDLYLIDPSQLPPQIRKLVDCIGLPPTFRLLEKRGGTPLRVPLYPNRAEVLREILSSGELQALCSAYGGQVLDLPKVDKMLIQIRNHAIQQARKTMSASETARAFNLTRRMVIYISGECEADKDQLDMFAGSSSH